MSEHDKWLVTGGAGYIGSHIADEFIRAGKSVVVYDSLHQGLVSRVKFLEDKYQVDIPLIKADILDYKKVDETIKEYKIYALYFADKSAATLVRVEITSSVNFPALIESNTGRCFAFNSSK